MNSKERLMTVFRGEIPDRVPVSFFVQEEFLSWYYPDIKDPRRLEEGVEFAQELDLDIMIRSKDFEIPHFMKKSFPNWEINSFSKVKGDNLYHIFDISTPKGELSQIEVSPAVADNKAIAGIHRSVSKYLIESRDDFEIFKQFVPKIDGNTKNEMKMFAEYASDLIGEQGILVPWGWAGVYNQAANYRSIEKLMIDSYTDPDFYAEYMETILNLEVDFNSVLADTAIDAIGIQGNVANSGILGKEYFDGFILPYEKRLVDALRSAGKPTIYHNCGKAKVLIESYVDMGITAWETIAEDPRGDNILAEVKKNFGKDLVLIGNIDQVDFLKKAKPEEIREKVREIVNVGKPGGNYIFAASDFLEKQTPIENIKAAIDTAKAEGVYSMEEEI